MSVLIPILIAIAGGLFRGFAGFGGGLLMAPLLTLIYPPSVVVPMLVVVALVGDMRLLPEVWSELNRSRVVWVAAWALLGLPAGIAALAALDGEVVRQTVNVVVLVVVVLLGSGARLRAAKHWFVLACTGILSGILTGIGGIGGPPVVLTYLSIDEPSATTRANLIGHFSISGTAALLMMFAAGVFGAESAKLAAICVAPYFIAVHFGSRYFRRATNDSYRPTALVFLGIVALFSLLWPVFTS